MLIDGMLLGLMIVMKLIGIPVSIRLCYFAAILLFLAIRVTSKPEYMSPLSWFTSAWLVVGGAYFTEFLEYSDDSKNTTAIVYLTLQSVCLVWGFTVGNRGARRKTSLIDRYSLLCARLLPKTQNVITLAALLGFVGACFFVVEMVYNNGASLANEYDIRDLYSSKQTSIFGQIAAVLLPGGYIALCGAVFYGNAVARRVRMLWIVAALSTIVNDLLSGGRQVTLQLSMLFLIAAAIRRAVTEKQKVTARSVGYRILSLIGVLAFLLYASYVALNRNYSIQAKYPAMLAIFGASVNPESEDMFYRLPDDGKEIAIVSYLYLTNSVANFQGDYKIKFSKMGYGLYLNPFVARRLASVIPGVRTVEVATEDAARDMEEAGVFSKGFHTASGSLLGEFGKFGSLLFAWVLGVSFGKCHKRFIAKPTLGRCIAVATACLVALYFPMAWAGADTTILFMAIGAGLLQFAESKWEQQSVLQSRLVAGL